MTRHGANPFAFPLEAMRFSTQFALMMGEAQWVVAMRLMGMGGVWNVTGGENARMMSEKPTAFLEAAMAGQRALMAGAMPAAAGLAALKPIRRKTRANARRLTRRGPTTKL